MKKKNKSEAEKGRTEKEPFFQQKNELQNEDHNIQKEALGRNTKR